MSIVIFGDSFSFPEGNAATNRVHTYAKGLVENGENVHVICFANNYTSNGNGLMNGYYFYHPFGQKKRSKYFIVRRWKKLIKYFKTISLTIKINNRDKIIAFNCWTQNSTTLLFVFLLSILTKSKLILERSEHPLRNFQDSYEKKLHGKVKLYIEINTCDSIFCISNNLMDFYKNNGFSKKLFLVPSTVDPSRFEKHGENPFSFSYIGYFGGLSFTRDNVNILIEAFAEITNDYPEIRLVIGGFCSENEKKQITDLITILNITNKVLILEYLKREEIINYIVHSHILVMVRANIFETQASYPSKLTEFLATSKPVVTVNVGEISDYLTDGVNVFLTEPGDSYALKEKLIFILDNYQLAQRVAFKGKELTNKIFNYNYQAKRMKDFIHSL